MSGKGKSIGTSMFWGQRQLSRAAVVGFLKKAWWLRRRYFRPKPDVHTLHCRPIHHANGCAVRCLSHPFFFDCINSPHSMLLSRLSLFPQEKEREVVETRRLLRPQVPRPDFNSPSVVSVVTCVRASTRRVWVPVHPCTWQPCWNTCVRKFWNWPGMPLVTTKSHVSSPVTFPSRSKTTKNSTSCSVTSPLLKVVSCPTSTPSCSPSRPR